MRKQFCNSFLLIVIVTGSYAQQTSNTGQKPAQQEEDIVRLSTTLVQIDAVVTDRNGKHVR